MSCKKLEKEGVKGRGGEGERREKELGVERKLIFKEYANRILLNMESDN